MKKISLVKINENRLSGEGRFFTFYKRFLMTNLKDFRNYPNNSDGSTAQKKDYSLIVFLQKNIEEASVR